ncbi:MAG TPA: zinc ABC transporter substrate-binding protein, partial [Cytophagaceae bacterium]|nr:zinc ABC transporter substrate-binding protein [Cytophagaceae bacterium]
MKKKNTIVLLILLAFLTNACHDKKENTTNKLKIATVSTTGMIADAIGAIAGDQAEVQALMGPGVDPHLYKVTQGDLKKLQDADLIFYNGLHLEGKMSEVLEKLSKKKKVIAISDGVEKTRLRMLDNAGHILDPHIWFNVSLWKDAVLFASAEIEKADSSHRSIYKENTRKFALALDSLDRWVKEQIVTIPIQNRLLITAHDAFGYFGEAYHIEVKGLQGISTVSDYGLSDVTSLVNLITSRKIKAIF